MDTKVWAIVPAKNVEKSISNTLRQLNRAGIHKTVVICNGCTDKTEQAIEQTIPDLNMDIDYVVLRDPLGHDVGRAYGAIYACRKKICTHILFVDGDWSGGFGPMLESWMKECFNRKLQIMWGPAEKQVDTMHPYLFPWAFVKQHIPPELTLANPSITPLMVAVSAFSVLSPYLLYHPGKWFAYAIRKKNAGLQIGVNPLWDGRLTGHHSQGYIHDGKMKETLIGDAVEGSCILSSKPFTRVFKSKAYIGFHDDRRIDLLLQTLSTIELQDTMND